jgi:serine phosphatase RsbU (regulator of sigma subunit)
VQVTLGKGEWLASFTDGLSESFNAAREPLDDAGIAGLLRRHFDSAEDVVTTLLRGEEAHRGARDPHDDLTTLVADCP